MADLQESSDAMSGMEVPPNHAGHDGDEETLVRLYPQLRRFAAVVAPPEVAPDDLVHDAIVAVLRSGRWSRLDDPVAYIKRTMINLASNERRRLGRSRRALNRLGADAVDAAADAYPSDLAHLAELRPEGRAVLYMHYVDGLSFEDIAVVLGRRPSAIRQAAMRARRQLRAHAKDLS